MAQRYCTHGFDRHFCEHESCEFYDRRPLYEQLFKPPTNSKKAAQLFGSPEYTEAKRLAIEHGLLPTVKIPQCLE